MHSGIPLCVGREQEGVHLFTPTILELLDSAKASLILRHQMDSFSCGKL